MIAKSQIGEIYHTIRRYLTKTDTGALLDALVLTKAFVRNKSFRDTVNALIDYETSLVKKDKNISLQ
jgi:hypothetical protein